MWARTTALLNDLRTTWRDLNENPDAGYASEAVLVTALLILGAIIVIGIIVAKVTSKANQIDLALLVIQTVAR
jgi:hypothetical protein